MARTHDVKRGDGYITERVNRDGSFTAQARWHDGGSWRARSFRGATPVQAREDAEDHLRSVGRAKRTGLYTPESTMSVADAVAEYLERGRTRWGKATVAQYTGLARNQIVPALGSVRIAELTPRRVQGWIDRLHASGLGSSTISNAKTVLSGALADAVRLGVIAQNPCLNTTLPRKERRTYVTWGEDDVAAILAASVGYHLHPFYIVALTTGMRPGELRALQWQDVDFERGTITCQRTMTKDERYRAIIGTVTKTRRVRVIAVPDFTIAALREVQRAQRLRHLAAPHWNQTGIIFDCGNGNPRPQQSIYQQHLRMCDRAGVPRCRLHDLRHTAATMMLRNGTPAKVVADILGHSSIQVTLDIYSHVDIDMQRTATDQLGEIVKRERRA